MNLLPAAALAVVLAYALTRPAQAAALPWIDYVAPDYEPDQLPSLFETLELTMDPSTYSTGTLPGDLADANVSAFLAMIRRAEGTDREADPYRVVMGYSHTIRDMSDHPYFTREWQGAYFGSPPQLSTAAGAYQFLRRTWSDLKSKLSLPDFGPASQDEAAIQLIRERGALADVRAGRFAAAVAKCAPTWASLPGAGYGQSERSLSMLAGAFTAAGGTITT